MPSDSTASSPPKAHGLLHNYNLSREQYEQALLLIDRVEALYRGAPAYVAQRGLDPEIHFPGNEWKDMVAIEGRSFHRAYPDINLLRLHAPFAGFHMALLDRLDSRLHPEPELDKFYLYITGKGFPDDIAATFAARVDPAVRLARTLGVDGKVIGSVEEMRLNLENVPPRYAVRTPRLFGEIGLELGGFLANPDTVLAQTRLNAMLSGGVLTKMEADVRRRGRVRVLEIGPGYGALGQALYGIFGEALEYIAVDLPAILYYPAVYLGTLQAGRESVVLLPGDKVPEHFRNVFVGNHLLEELEGPLGPIDVAINTMSFTEMSEVQVRFYAETMNRMLRPDGLVFEENDANRPHHSDSKKILGEVFPYRKSVSSSVVRTKIAVNDIWSKIYVPDVFDCSDHALRLGTSS
ncbi:MAG: putative sugar O-methyltransferase [Proteobacteria bacterium]|nr:putative sugar O-methyltransferase [Pseudomonadota bacterium]